MSRETWISALVYGTATGMTPDTVFVLFGLFNYLPDGRQVYFPTSIGSNNLNSTAQRSVLKIYGDGITNKASNTLGNTPLSIKSIAIAFRSLKEV